MRMQTNEHLCVKKMTACSAIDFIFGYSFAIDGQLFITDRGYKLKSTA